MRRLSLSIAAFLAFRLFRNFYFHIAVTVPFFSSHGLSLTQIFTLESIYYLAKVIGDIPTGIFADIYSKRVSVALSGFVGAAGYLLMGISDSVIGFGIAEAMLGIAVAFFSGADSTAILYQLEQAGKSKLYPRVESFGWAARNLGFGLAAICGGYVAATYGPTINWFLTGASVFISGILILALPDDRAKERVAQRRNSFQMVRDVVEFMRQDLFVAGVLIYFAAVFSLVRIGLWFLQPMVKELGFGVSMNGVLFAGSIAISIFFGSLSGRLFGYERIKESLFFVTFSGVMFPVFWAISVVYKINAVVWLSFIIGFLMFGALQGLYDPVAKIWVAARIPKQIRTTVLSTGSLTANFVFAGIGPLAGYLTDRLSMPVALVILAGIHLVPLTIAAVLLLRLKEESLDHGVVRT